MRGPEVQEEGRCHQGADEAETGEDGEENDTPDVILTQSCVVERVPVRAVTSCVLECSFSFDLGTRVDENLPETVDHVCHPVKPHLVPQTSVQDKVVDIK